MKITTKITGNRAVRAELQRIGSLPRRALDKTIEELEEYVEAAARPGPPPDAVPPHTPANPAYVPMYAGPSGITAPRRPFDLRARLLVIAALALDN